MNGGPRITRPVLRYHGGKKMLAPWIISHFPAHAVYVESFMGAASVFMAKPRAYAEVINDLCGEVVSLFRILRDPEQSAELARLLTLTPFSREEMRYCEERSPDPLEDARRLVSRSFMGFGSAAFNRDHNTGFRGARTGNQTSVAVEWASYPEQLRLFTERLRGVVIENQPAVNVIQRYDTENCLHYVDPPYPHGTRTFKRRASGQVYRHEMTDDQHRELAEVLHASQGMVVISGYGCPLYDEELYPGWQRVERPVFADGQRPRVEVLWISPRTWDALHPPAQARQPVLSLFEEPDPQQVCFTGADGAELRGIPERFAPEDWPGEGAAER